MTIPQSIKENPSAAPDASKSILSEHNHNQNQNEPSTPTASVIDKTRARLELVLLQGENNSNGRSKIKKQIDAIKGIKGATDVATTDVELREDAKVRATEQRKKAIDAKELLSKLEKDAEEAIVKAKDAMKRANAAWVEAGREERKALELEHHNGTLQHMEEDQLNIKLEDRMNVVDDTSQRISSTGEGYFTKYFKLSIKNEDLQKDRDELDACLKERETTIQSLRDKDKLHEERIMALNKRHEKEVSSMNEYIKETGQSLRFWKHQSKILVEKLQITRRKKSEQEKEVMIIKDMLNRKLRQIDELQAEIEDLRQTKDQFETELPSVVESQRSDFLQLKVDADALLEDKEHSWKTLRIVSNSYLKALEQFEEHINIACDDISVYEEELRDANNKQREAKEPDGIRNDEVKQLKEECSRWKKKATSLNLKLDVLKDETQSQKREIIRLKKSAADFQDRLFSRLLSDHKMLKKKAKDLQLNLCLLKKEVRERDAKVKERDAIIDELKKNTLSSSSDALQRSASYWKYEATKLQEKLTKIEKQSRVRDAMIEISSEISGLKIRQFDRVQSILNVSPGPASVSFDMEEIDVAAGESTKHDAPTQVSP